MRYANRNDPDNVPILKGFFWKNEINFSFKNNMCKLLNGENGAEGKEVALPHTEEVLRFIAEVSETGCNNRVTPHLPPTKPLYP